MTQEPARQMKKERETKDDGRYMIFYTFNEERQDKPIPEREEDEA